MDVRECKCSELHEMLKRRIVGHMEAQEGGREFIEEKWQEEFNWIAAAYVEKCNEKGLDSNLMLEHPSGGGSLFVRLEHDPDSGNWCYIAT